MKALLSRRARFQAAATALALLSLAGLLMGCGGLHPSGGPPAPGDGVSHQPATFSRMEQLVTPDDPAVTQALHDALNPPPTVIYGVTYSLTPQNKPSDFQLIMNWASTHCIYTTDQDNYGVPDYWATPAETIARGSGDCEDYSILLCSLLRAYGVPADQIYAAVGKDPTGTVHSWLIEKYYNGIWRLLDTQRLLRAETPVLGSLRASSYTTSYCFNDASAFYGEPAVPAGVYEFESPGTSFPLDKGAVTSYYRYVNAGQKITAQIEWLAYSLYWPFNPNIIEAWSFNIYDAGGATVSAWSGTDTEKTLEYTPALTGIYRIEIVKRDNPARPARITLAPLEGWTSGTPLRIDLLRVELAALPAVGIKTLPETTPVNPPVTQAAEVPPAALITVPQGLLIQHTLDTINAQQAEAGQAAIGLGTNSAAQQHAEDMASHDFVSGWGTDGSTPNQRYNLAGGTGAQTEYDYRTEIDWNGDPATFGDALLLAIDASKIKLPPSTKGAVYAMTSQGIVVAGSADTSMFQLQPDRVNIGIAYNAKYLYLTVEYESFYMTYDQAPAFHDGVVSVSGHYAAGVKIQSIEVSYQPLPGPLTTSQISYASTSNYNGRSLAYFRNYSGFLGVTFMQSSAARFFDPHWAPPGAPAIEQSDINLTMLLEGMTGNSGPSKFDVEGLSVNATGFSFSYDLSDLIKALGKGVYTVSLIGLCPSFSFTPVPGGIVISGYESGSYQVPLSAYTIVVN